MPSIVPAAARALGIFEVFAREKRELTNAELAKCLGLPESSCSDLVSTLVDIGYVARSRSTRKLYPTGRLFAVALSVNGADWRTRRLQDVCEAVRDEIGESVLCGALGKRVVTVLAFAAGRDRLRYTSAPGDQVSLHVSSLGKAILTRMTPSQVAREFGTAPYEKLASCTLTDPVDLVQQVDSFREQGWVLLENESIEGLASLAVSGCYEGEVLALSITGLQSRVVLNQTKYLETLRKAAQDVFAPP